MNIKRKFMAYFKKSENDRRRLRKNEKIIQL